MFAVNQSNTKQSKALSISEANRSTTSYKTCLVLTKLWSATPARIQLREETCDEATNILARLGIPAKITVTMPILNSILSSPAVCATPPGYPDTLVEEATQKRELRVVHPRWLLTHLETNLWFTFDGDQGPGGVQCVHQFCPRNPLNSACGQFNPSVQGSLPLHKFAEDAMLPWQ